MLSEIAVVTSSVPKAGSFLNLAVVHAWLSTNRKAEFQARRFGSKSAHFALFRLFQI